MFAARRIATVASRRSFSTALPKTAGRSRTAVVLAGGSVAALATVGVVAAESTKVDYDAVSVAVQKQLEDDEDMGPTLIRLAWHASGTYDKATKTGGSNGATMRFAPELNHGANAGLAKAQAWLEPVKAQFPGITYADLWILSSYAAIEYMQGPKIPFRAGRADAPSGESCPPEGRLPDGQAGPADPESNESIVATAAHVRKVFNAYGFNDKQMTCLIGAHALGRCHTDASGYEGPWTNAPTTFSNDYYTKMLELTWTVRAWSGPAQYETFAYGKNTGGDLMMLPADLVLVRDPEFRKTCELYSKDNAAFAKDFGAVFKQLTELGMPSKSWFAFLGF